jgi:hypothetical protein
MRPRGLAWLACMAALPSALLAQSALLSAIESSAPAPIGLPGIWLDPTTAPRATGAFFSMYQTSYTALHVFHAAAAFHLGPRWSLAYGQSEIPELFDSTLTNIDPGLSTLRAQALWGALDATAGPRWLTGSVGLALARDDNVGDVRNGTVARVALRTSPLHGVTVGLRTARAIGGSLPAEPAGRTQLDATAGGVLKARGDVAVFVGAGVVRGSLWRYGETRDGFRFGGSATVASRLTVAIGAGRYTTAFGATTHEWDRSAMAALRVATVRLAVRYTSTRVGAGSGYAVSLAYEAPMTAR